MPAAGAIANERRAPLGVRLIACAERWFDIPEGAIQNPKRRNGYISQARWAVTLVLTNVAGWSQPKIAALFGCDPSSVHNGQRRARELVKTDPVFFEAVARLEQELVAQ